MLKGFASHLLMFSLYLDSGCLVLHAHGSGTHSGGPMINVNSCSEKNVSVLARTDFGPQWGDPMRSVSLYLTDLAR